MVHGAIPVISTVLPNKSVMSVTSNPYAPPTTEPAAPEPTPSTHRLRRGPALYVAGFGLLGGFGAIPFLAIQNAIGFAVVLIGCILGGIVYRFRSRNWPHDPTIFQRQLKYSAISVVMPPAVMFMFAGPNGQGPAFMLIGLIVGVSVACGILVSGSRRLNAPQEKAEQ
jgi:hypothetical protein